MTPYNFRCKVNGETIAQLCEERVINSVILWQVE